MAATNGSMKKHEACYWLNVLIEEERSSIKYHTKNAAETERVTDWKTGEKRMLTEEEMEHNHNRAAEEIAKCEKKLSALDIAAEALTG